jgi:predicted NBD/HSP70 family sugar kinase
MPLQLSPSSSAGNAPSTLRTLGSNQVGMREFNERVVLQAIRLHGSLPKADLARLTKLSTQTVSVIIDRLLEEGLVRRLESRRGKVGQPSRPIALHPDAAFAIGVQIGRRSLDVLLIDFEGTPRWRASTGYATPEVEPVFAAIGAQLARVHGFLGEAGARRLTGVGLAAPLAFGGWQQLLRMPARAADAWTRTDMRERLQALTTLPVEFAKDTAAACVAELVAGRGRSMRNYLYVFIDTLVGGGLVIDSQPHGGLYGNAGAIASMPLGLAGGADPAPGQGGQGRQLLEEASLVTLEKMLAEAGLPEIAFTDERALQAPWAAVTRRWIERAANAIAYAGCSAACLLDLDGIIVDGVLDRTLLAELLEATRAALGRYSWQGVMRPQLHAGETGAEAKVMGAAYLPLHANFAPVHGLFLKSGRP